MSKIFKNKTLLITGGTGSFGKAVLKQLHGKGLKEIRIFSRDEKKQHDLRNSELSRDCKFYLGDIRDRNSINLACKDVNYIFHAAALKQVPSCEFNPMEAVKTNVIGTDNVLTSAIDNHVDKVVCLSTDKAVYPINTMGMTKGLMEKVATGFAREAKHTTITVTRYGNVMGSRGSVIPFFKEQILNGVKPTVTDPKMTRFMMTLDHAVTLVFHAFRYGKQGNIYIKKAKSCEIGHLALAMCSKYGVKPAFDLIGHRHGEKLFETLVSREEMSNARIHKNYYCVEPDRRDIDYHKYYSKGQINRVNGIEFNSENADRLSQKELLTLLNSL